MPAIGKEPGKAVADFTGCLVQRGEGGSRATRCRNPVERHGKVRCKDDHTVLVPTSAAAVEGRAEGQDRPSGDIHLLQITVGKERDEAAVGRPEGVMGAIRAGQSSRHQRIEFPHPKLLLSVYRSRKG
jgi:hypothetical protein